MPLFAMSFAASKEIIRMQRFNGNGNGKKLSFDFSEKTSSDHELRFATGWFFTLGEALVRT